MVTVCDVCVPLLGLFMQYRYKTGCKESECPRQVTCVCTWSVAGSIARCVSCACSWADRFEVGKLVVFDDGTEENCLRTQVVNSLLAQHVPLTPACNVLFCKAFFIRLYSIFRKEGADRIIRIDHAN